MKSHIRAAAAICAILAASISLEAKELDAAMQQYVIASCSSDAYKLCPASLGNQQEAVSCMKSKRSQLNQVCRVAYDKVARTLAQK